MADDEVINPLGSPTTNYGWIKPTVGADDDVWGGFLNTDLDNIDTTVKSVSNVANAAYPASNPSGYQTAAQVAAAIPPAYVLPTASTTVLGGVKVDGSTITISGGGVISGASSGASIAVSDTPPSSPSTGALWWDSVGGQMYVWYNDGNSSQWVPVVNQGYAASSVPLIVRPPVATSWTQRNFNAGVTTVTDVANGVCIFDTSTQGSSNILRGISVAAPSTPYTIDALMCTTGLQITSAFYKVGIGWTDGTKVQVMWLSVNGGSAQGENYTNYTTYAGSAIGTSGSSYLVASGVWFRLRDDGTNIYYYYGTDGVSWALFYSVAKASGFLGASGYSNPIVLVDAIMGNGGFVYLTLKSWWVH